MQYTELCVFSLSIFRVLIVGIGVLYVIIIIKSQVWGLSHEMMIYLYVVLCSYALLIWYKLRGILYRPKTLLYFRKLHTWISKYIFLFFFSQWSKILDLTSIYVYLEYVNLLLIQHQSHFLKIKINFGYQYFHILSSFYMWATGHSFRSPVSCLWW